MLDLSPLSQLWHDKSHRLSIENARLSRMYSTWKDKAVVLEQEKNQWQHEKADLQKEIEKLKQEIDKLTKTNNRYQIALFDHGNCQTNPHHDASTPPKKKGGQDGHLDTNRESKEDQTSIPHRRIHAVVCPDCGKPLKRVRGIKSKFLLTILLQSTVIREFIDSERQWCGSCHKEVRATDDQSLPFTEYGLNLFLLVMMAKFQLHLTDSQTATLIRTLTTLPLTPSVINNLLTQAHTYLGDKYNQLIKSARKRQLVYQDETGWLVRGKRAWLWLMATDEETIYYAAESRGKGIVEELYGNSTALSMHDGYAAYASVIDSDHNLYCWAHILRYAFEETITSSPGSLAIQIRDQLTLLYHLKETLSSETLEATLNTEMTNMIHLKSDEIAVHHLQTRLATQKDGLIRALIKTRDGTNNLGEREIRPMVQTRKTSFGSDTYQGMQRAAALTSIVRTIQRNNQPLLPTLATYLKQGITKKHPTFVYS